MEKLSVFTARVVQKIDTAETADAFLEYGPRRNLHFGRNIQEINTSDLRDMESYVTQETYLFHDSIAGNIAVGRPGASEEEIIEAAKKASLHDFVMSLPDGYHTPVGELGSTLSGGERQRIVLQEHFCMTRHFSF